MFVGIESGEEVKELMTEFTAHGREMFGTHCFTAVSIPLLTCLGDINLESKLHKAARVAASMASNMGGSAQQARAYSTTSKTQSLNVLRSSMHPRGRFVQSSSRSYATTTKTTNPNPPYGTKNSSNSKPAKIALVGARGYTGQALIVCLPFLQPCLSRKPYFEGNADSE